MKKPVKIVNTFGKDLNQNTLQKLVEHIFYFSKDQYFEEWQETTLKDIINTCLYVTNDYFMDGAFTEEDVIVTNKLIADLRTSR